MPPLFFDRCLSVYKTFGMKKEDSVWVNGHENGENKNGKGTETEGGQESAGRAKT